MWLTMWPVTWPTETNENTRVARGTLSAITVGSSNLCTGPKFRAAAPIIVADQNFSVVLDLFTVARADRVRERYSLFYVGNGKGVAYFSKRMTRIRILYCLMKRQPVKTTYTWSETYFRQDLFPSYLFFGRQFHAIVIFRLKSISDLDSGYHPRFLGEFIFAKLTIVLS